MKSSRVRNKMTLISKFDTKSASAKFQLQEQALHGKANTYDDSARKHLLLSADSLPGLINEPCIEFY